MTSLETRTTVTHLHYHHFGNLRSGKKSDMGTALEDLSDSTTSNEMPLVDAILLDGAAVVNMLKPNAGMKFSEYSAQVFLPYIKDHLLNVHSVDIVWDVYLKYSLKTTTRSRRGSGVRRRVLPETEIPTARWWQSFMRVDENKIELFQFLANEMKSIDPEFGDQSIQN